MQTTNHYMDVSKRNLANKWYESVVLNIWVKTPLGGQVTLSQGSHIRYSGYQIFTL